MQALAFLFIVLAPGASGLSVEQRGPLDAIAKFRQHHRKTVGGRSIYEENNCVLKP